MRRVTSVCAMRSRRTATPPFTSTCCPDLQPERVLVEVRHPRARGSLSSHLKSRLGLGGIKAGVLYEHLGRDGMNDPVALAHAIKSAAASPWWPAGPSMRPSAPPG